MTSWSLGRELVRSTPIPWVWVDFSGIVRSVSLDSTLCVSEMIHGSQGLPCKVLENSTKMNRHGLPPSGARACPFRDFHRRLVSFASDSCLTEGLSMSSSMSVPRRSTSCV